MSERRPTIDHAVEIIMNLILRESRIAQLWDWRHKFGDAYADQVAAKAKARWAKERGKRK